MEISINFAEQEEVKNREAFLIPGSLSLLCLPVILIALSSDFASS